MRRESVKKIRILGTVLFAAYLVLLVYLLFFAERYGRGADAGRHINLAPLREIRRFLNSRDTLGERAVFLNVYGNVLLFVPFGAILPVLHRHFRSFPVTFAYGFVLSVTVELIQYASCRGSCDIDDVLLNTLGCTAGYVIFSFEHDLNSIEDLSGLSIEDKWHNAELSAKRVSFYEDFMPTLLD